MQAPNLTKETARQRSNTIKVNKYKINIDLTDEAGNLTAKYFRTTTEVSFTAQHTKSTFIDLMAATIHRAILNNKSIDTSNYSSQAGLTLEDLQVENTLIIEADFVYSATGEGLHKFIDPVDNETYLYSQFETADAKRMFACFDQPNMKSIYELTVQAPANWQVISNSQQVSSKNGKFCFAPTKPLSTYLVALIAGPYAVWTDTYQDKHSTIPLGIYCRKSLAKYMDSERIFIETKQGFSFYHELFNYPYPFGKYDQLFVPEFNAGAMENAGAVTFRDEYVFTSKVTDYRYERRADTILHEMAHMWFGDLVTMRWWEDLWLNESFASFAAILAQTKATSYKDAWATFATVEKSWAYQQDQLPTTHPVAANIPDHAAVEVNFDGITYAKGAALLKQLVSYIGLDNFVSGLREYFQKFAFSNASFDDLITCLANSTSKNLLEWSNSWLKTTGVNQLSAHYRTDEHDKITEFTIQQSGAKPGKGELRVHHLELGLYDFVDDLVKRTDKVTVEIAESKISLPEVLGKRKPALVLVNEADLGYCLSTFDSDSLSFINEHINEITEPLTRAVIWTTLWEMVRNEQLPAREFITITLKGLTTETQLSIVEFLLRNIQLTIADYANSFWVEEQGQPYLVEHLLNLINTSNLSDDHRLAFLNTLCSLNQTTNATGLLYELLTDKTVNNWAHIEIDNQLAWNIIQHLATINFPKMNINDLIGAQLDSNNSAASRLNAETALAAISTREAKENAWQQIFSFQDSLSITRARIAGFVRTNDKRLLSEFSSAYFQQIAAVWKNHSNETSQTLTTGLYPKWDPQLNNITKQTEDILKSATFTALKRLLTECLARYQQAHRIQQYDN